MQVLHSTDPLTVLTGIGAVKAAHFSALGANNLGELCELFPKSYRQNKVTRLIDAIPDEPCGFCFRVLSLPSVSYYPGGKRLLRFTAGDDTGKVSIVFFNQPYLKGRFEKGNEYFFYGTLRHKDNKYSLFSPEFEDMSSFTEGIKPIYPSTDGLSAKAVKSAIDAIYPYIPELICSLLPNEVEQRMKFASRADSVCELHRPTSSERLISAKRRLIFEELFFFSLRLRLLKKRTSAETFPAFALPDMKPFYNALGFEMTSAQSLATDDIIADLTSVQPIQKPVMNRLIQGDVGSGKTAVAAAAIYITIKNGANAALMAPTELLAKQHYDGLGRLFSSLGIKTLLLTGSAKKSERERIFEELSGNERFLIIGTHALIEENVLIPHLGLTITDEQHRFGVRQRGRLNDKSCCKNMLFMSATPIPRTLALFLFADKSISIIGELPPGRQKIETYLISENSRSRADEFIEKQIDGGHRVYVVCPLISDSDSLSGVMSAEACYERLKKRFPQCRIGFLHGKLSPASKDKIMSDFASGGKDILVSTSVIEVGINVPEATLMQIENAERFGLSALHQLRGRVGRGKDKSYCILISSAKSGSGRERLETLRDNDDGFALAEFDLKSRGPGDFFGSQQTGKLAFEFFTSGIMRSSSESVMELIERAKSEAARYCESSDTAALERRYASDELMN